MAVSARFSGSIQWQFPAIKVLCGKQRAFGSFMLPLVTTLFGAPIEVSILEITHCQESL
jgi:hypothetical protein